MLSRAATSIRRAGEALAWRPRPPGPTDADPAVRAFRGKLGNAYRPALACFLATGVSLIYPWSHNVTWFSITLSISGVGRNLVSGSSVRSTAGPACTYAFRAFRVLLKINTCTHANTQGHTLEGIRQQWLGAAVAVPLCLLLGLCSFSKALTGLLVFLVSVALVATDALTEPAKVGNNAVHDGWMAPMFDHDYDGTRCRCHTCAQHPAQTLTNRNSPSSS